MKATSIFGSVQVFTIIISIIRSKILAILLGPEGIGILGLLQPTIRFIGRLTSFGLGVSAVRDVAAANRTGNRTRIAIVVTVLRRWIWATGIFGSLLMLSLSPWLSELSFGNRDYTVAFIWLSITILLNQLSKGQLVILRGMRKLQYLAKASVLGSAIGLAFSIPLYFVYGIDGIVPAIITSSVVSLFMSWYFSKKIKIDKLRVSKIRTVAEGKNMLSMGFMISLSGLMGLGASYVIRFYISDIGGIEQVGLFAVGFTLTNKYVGLIFTAMSTDYYPRLSAVAHSNELCKETINQQAEIAVLLLAPILLVFIVFVKWVIILLYSKEFIAVDGMVHWAALGIFLKAASWSISFIFLAKGVSKLFFWNELLASIYVIGLNLLGYYLMGLTGLGISFMLGFLLYLIQVFIISKVKFDFSFDPSFLRIFGFQFSLAILGFIVITYVGNPFEYIIGLLLILISTWYSYIELDKRIGIKSVFTKLISKHKK